MERFPFMFFNGLKEVFLDYDIGTTPGTGSWVKYGLVLDLEKNDFIHKRYEALEKSIRNLFWKEVVIEILINGKEVYKSEQPTS
jgi:hypothetical protein